MNIPTAPSSGVTVAVPPNRNSALLANQILTLIRERGFEQGCHLREQQFADILGVSRTPVRSALTLLSTIGIVEARKNHGFILTRPYHALDGIQFDVPPTADQALYEALLHDRLLGNLPELVTQTEIERRYHHDRPTVLRALARMEDDRLIVRRRGQGWTFLPTLDVDQTLQHSFDLRLTVEPAGLLLATFRPDRPALERMRAQHLHLLAHPDIATVAPSQLFEADAAFHEEIARLSGNSFFVQIIQQQNRLRRLLEFSSYVERTRILEWCREHIAILDAILEGKRSTASQLMRNHLTNAFRVSHSMILSPAKTPPRALHHRRG